MMMLLGGAISISEANQIMALVLICECIGLCPGQVAEDVLYCFPMYTSGILEKLQ